MIIIMFHTPTIGCAGLTRSAGEVNMIPSSISPTQGYNDALRTTAPPVE